MKRIIATGTILGSRLRALASCYAFAAAVYLTDSIESSLAEGRAFLAAAI